MNALNPYLNFKGNCRQAMTFYKKCLGGELELMTFGDAPGQAPAGGEKDKIMHAHLKKGEVVLMASDCPPGVPLSTGNNVSLSLACENVKEQEQIFTMLAEGGKITLPLQDMFWGARFGMVTDQFGIHWMLNCEKK